VLGRAGSGYGREQLLLLALRLACRQMVRDDARAERTPMSNEGDLMDAYVYMAEIELDMVPEAEPEEPADDDPF
jgi:hypothetical protein